MSDYQSFLLFILSINFNDKYIEDINNRIKYTKQNLSLQDITNISDGICGIHCQHVPKQYREEFNKKRLEVIVPNVYSYAGILRCLGLKSVGGNYKTLTYYLNKNQISIKHFTGKIHNKGKTHNHSKSIPLEIILTKNSNYHNTDLKRRLIKIGLLEDKCYICGINEWLGKKLSLHVDHMNGVNNDNRIENIRLLCPNCHSLTDSYCGKNKNKLPV